MEKVNSLTELISRAGAGRFTQATSIEDLGLAEHLPFPFLAIVGQADMKLALLLSVINPNIGGVLLIGPRGTGKTTVVRGIADLLPDVNRSRCHYGCLPEDISVGGLEAVCPDCAKRYGEGEPLTYFDRVRLIELPLNSELDDVVGGVNERAAVHNRLRVERGILSRADRNILYVDEVNLLNDEIVDAVLDAAAQGIYTVRRGPLSATYRSRFTLIGSMNPEEGRLRPQILDRFGLRVLVRGLEDPNERFEAYQRSITFYNSPRAMIADHQVFNDEVRQEISTAREKVITIQLTDKAQDYGLALIQELAVHSLRAEISLFEAAKAYAVADGREQVEVKDIQQVAKLALRLRRSPFIDEYLKSQSKEEREIDKLISSSRKRGKRAAD